MTAGSRVTREPAETHTAERGTGPFGSARPEPPADPRIEPPAEVTLFSLLQLLWRQRVVIVATTLLVVGAAATAVLMRPRSYSTTVAFTTQSDARESTLSGLAAQFGLAVPVAGGANTPPFYLELLRSRALLRAIVQHEYVVPTDTGTMRGTLVRLWRVEGENEPRRVDAAMERLESSMVPAASQQTGIVRVTVRAAHAELARQIAEQVVELLNQFNLQTRRSRAAAEREFVERRLATVRDDLRTAENRLQAFLQQNRGFISSAPALRFEEDRLSRDVTLQRQLFTTLTEAFEKAKIDEVRDTPVITVVEPPELAVRPDRRGLLQTGAVAGLGGLALGVMLALLRELARIYGRQRRAAAAPAAGPLHDDGR